MTEWQIILLLGELLGLLGLVGAPVLKLNSTLTKINVKLEAQTSHYKETVKANHEEHMKFEGHLEEHDTAIADHEVRLKLIEKSGE